MVLWLREHHLHHIHNKSSHRPNTSAKENMVGIWSLYPNVDSGSLDPDYFQDLTGTSLSKDTSVTKFSWKSDHSLWRYKPNCGKHCGSQCWRILQKILGSGGGWLPKFNQFFLMHSYICSKIFVKIHRVFLRKVSYRQTNRQMPGNRGHYTMSLADIIIMTRKVAK